MSTRSTRCDCACSCSLRDASGVNESGTACLAMPLWYAGVHVRLLPWTHIVATAHAPLNPVFLVDGAAHAPELFEALIGAVLNQQEQVAHGSERSDKIG